MEMIILKKREKLKENFEKEEKRKKKSI